MNSDIQKDAEVGTDRQKDRRESPLVELVAVHVESSLSHRVIES